MNEDQEIPLVRADDALPPSGVIFGNGPVMREVRRKIERLAGTSLPVLILGENGTGKEILARFLHGISGRSHGPLVKVNCPAIPSALLESELFGYEKGAFTGAYGTKPGRVEMAHRGTLFFDEIGELELGLQAKLLQLLQDGEFSRIGARGNQRIEVRVVCATNRRLEQEVEAGSFRRDLFYRINVATVQLPPLRERAEDIPGLVAFFIRIHGIKFDRSVPAISAPTLSLMETHAWPGNIRQLENLIKRYVILGSEDSILEELESADGSPGHQNTHLRIPSIRSGEILPLKDMMRHASMELERNIILKALQVNRWNRKQTAQCLRISYRALLYKIRQAGLNSHTAAP